MNNQQNQDSANFELENVQPTNDTDQNFQISDFEKWLDSELAKLVDQHEEFVTKNSNRSYYSR